MNTCGRKGDTKMSYSKKSRDITQVGKLPVESYSGQWDMGIWCIMRMLIRDLGDIGVSVAADSTEVKTEKKGAAEEHQRLRWNAGT